MQVLKFGGSSVANATNINKVVDIVLKAAIKEPTILVVSAMGGVTDSLINTGKLSESGDESYKTILKELENKHLDAVRDLLPIQQQSATLSQVKQKFNELEAISDGVFLLGELSERTNDKMVSYGELLSSLMIAAKIKSIETSTLWVDSRLLIRTNSEHGKATVDFSITTENITGFYNTNAAKIYVAPGFISSDQHNHTTTLGRGGSDYTGAIYAAALQASVLEIWTDVSGMMTADPRLVNNARPIHRISYQEAMELSHFGAKIIYPPTIQPVMKQNIPVWIKNTFAPEEYGTLIENISAHTDNIIRGISSINKISLLSLEGSGMVGIPGFSKRLFEALANESVNVILITQSSSEHSICVGINEAETAKAKRAIDHAFSFEIQSGKVEPLKVEKGLSIVENDYNEKVKQVEGLIDSINIISKKGVLKYEQQSDALSLSYAQAIIKGSSPKVMSQIEEKMDIVAKYGPLQEMLNNELKYETEQLVLLRNKLKQVKIDAENFIPHKFIVERAYKAERKTYPKRMLIALIATVSGFLFSCLFFIFVENLKDVKIIKS